MREGSHKARIGNAIKITRRIKSVMINGMTPLKMVVKLTSFTTLFITNTFIPTGGWMRPSSTVMLTRCARRHERNLDRVIGERDRKRFIQILKKIAAELG